MIICFYLLAFFLVVQLLIILFEISKLQDLLDTLDFSINMLLTKLNDLKSNLNNNIDN